jgi:hypothetical protein
MTARKNANAGPRFHQDPSQPPGRQDVTMWPIKLTGVPDHPVVPVRRGTSRRVPAAGIARNQE